MSKKKLRSNNFYSPKKNEVEDSEVEDSEVEAIREEIKVEKFIPYSVRVLVKRLKYFAGPGTNYSYLGLVKQNDVFKILEETDGVGSLKWGRIELSTSVWLPLDYCTKLD